MAGKEELKMKHLRVVCSLATYLLLLVGIGLVAQNSVAQTSDSKTVADLQALLKKHDEAFKNQDVAAVMAVYAPGPNTVVMGTGPGERWEGKQEIESAYSEMFKDFDKGTVTSNCYWRTGGAIGDIAWLATMCKFTDSLKNKPREYELNVTVVAEKVGGKWLFRAVHFSNLTGGN